MGLFCHGLHMDDILLDLLLGRTIYTNSRHPVMPTTHPTASKKQWLVYHIFDIILSI
jgi:hypothetical protein